MSLAQPIRFGFDKEMALGGVFYDLTGHFSSLDLFYFTWDFWVVECSLVLNTRDDMA